MANKKITELTRAANIGDDDLLLLETADGTRSIPYSKIKEPIDIDIRNVSQPRPFANNAAAHNCIFRGKDLTNVYTIEEITDRISNDTFEDLYIGDYFDVTISTEYTENEVVRCVLAGFDYYYDGNSDYWAALPKHHAVIVTKYCFNKKSPIASENFGNDNGCFIESGILTITLPIYQAALQSILGNHIIEWKQLIQSDNNSSDNDTSINTISNILEGRPISYSSYKTGLNLLSEIQVFGTSLSSCSSIYNNGYDTCQLPLFALDLTAKFSRKPNDNSLESYWLRNYIGCSDDYKLVNGSPVTLKFYNFSCFLGNQVNYKYSSYGSNNYGIDGLGIRPFFCIG
ncbi:MAG: hypothetical protein HFH72_10260 [Lachnospiraceae bacterium]|nr:hypothetical protein [Lachnospiraceae bacterium]